MMGPESCRSRSMVKTASSPGIGEKGTREIGDSVEL